MERLNCYSILVRDGRVFHRRGIACDALRGNKMLLNGLGLYRLYKTPVELEDGIADEELLRRFVEAGYDKSDPWIGYNNDTCHLYGARIDPNNLYLRGYNSEKAQDEYVQIRVPEEYDIRVLGGGRILYKRFEAGELVAMLAIRGASMIDIESEDELVIMVEALGQGEFVCR